MIRHRFLLKVEPDATSGWRIVALCAPNLARAGNGWLAGQPFGRDGRPVALEQWPIGADPIETARRQGWWGGFLAAGRDAAGHVRLLRDPSGVVPCYFLSAGSSWLFASDVRALLESAGRPPAIDRAGLGLALRFPDLRSERTSLEGVRELLPGQACAIDRAGALRLSSDWLPERWRASNEPPDAAVRRAVLDAVGCALRDSAAPLVQLSGGLDSAIVAAAARQFRTGIVAINLVTPGPEGDERGFARAVAAHLGFMLCERHVRVEDIDVLTTRAGFLPRPTHRLFAQSMDQAVQETALASGHDAVLTGGGGDSVFSYLMPGFATADPLSRFAWTRALSTALDEASIDQVSAWRILRLGLRHALSRAPWREARRHLSAEILALPAPIHPWLRASRNWPPGKRAHVAALVTIHNYLDCFDAQPVPVRFPLLHRPVLDACLRIPSPSWVAGGRDRSVARKAFAADLPQAVLRRRSKGTYERFAALLFARHRSAIREHLLGGRLRDLGILDGASVEAWFAQEQDIRSNRLLALTEAESWCRYWTG